MKRTATLATLVAAATLFTIQPVRAQFTIGVSTSQTVVADTGQSRRQPQQYERVRVSVPAPPANVSSAVAPGGTVVSNLGAFDIVINPNPTLASNAAALAAFNRAAAQWEAVFSDPVTINIDAGLAALGPGILAQASSPVLQGPFNTFRNSLVADAADEADDTIVASLPTAAQAAFSVPTGFALNGNLTASFANSRALGFDVDAIVGAGVADGMITFSTGFSFDFDNSDGVTPGAFDFESIALHEIGHSLGVFSVVDTIDFFASTGTTSNQIQPSVWDLFRFEDGSVDDPDTPAEFTTDARSLIPGSDDIIDQIIGGFGDVEVLVESGAFTGSGQQASHFLDGLGLGILDPTLAPGEVVTLSQNDIRTLDLIGYDFNPVPEPTSVALVASALGLLGYRRRDDG